MVGWRDNFANFVRGDRAMDIDCRADLLNNYNERVMVTKKLGKHTVEMYDSIDELSVVRFHKYQKLLLVDSGVGADIAAFDAKMDKVRRFIASGKSDKAMQELDNVRQGVYLIQNEISPKCRAFAALVSKIDGKPCEDLSDAGLDAITKLLSDSPYSQMTAVLEAVKKKIDTELTLYFPSLFEDSKVKEYYDLMRKRTLALLQAIIDGKENPSAEVNDLTTALVCFSNPKVFSGVKSAEIDYDKQFENLCLALSEQLHIKPKECSVLEFYNAFGFLQDKAKQAAKFGKTRK